MDSILSVNQVTKNYKGFKLDRVSFDLQRGYIMGFIGPNGAGKSTTIKLIMNLVRKDEGTINVFDMDSVKKEKEIKNRIGFVYDQNCYYEELKMSEMKSLISKFYTKWDDALYNRYCKEFGLSYDKKIKELSKGMKMKFAIAIALSHGAELILMDEPTSGLDPVVRSELMDLLHYIIEDGDKSVFFSTHITTDLESTADYITFINDGKIVFSDIKDDIMEKYAVIKGEKDLIKQGIEDSCISIMNNNFGFSALIDDKPNFIKKYKNKVIIEKPTLDDIMVFYKRGEHHA
jgi:ABC-type multidrug transport system, ATPase component